jgi:pilus assembly protein Flp/PilA
MNPNSQFRLKALATRWLANFLADERGVTAIEYGLLGALIVVACVGAFTNYAAALGQLFNTWCTAVMGAL